LKFEAQLTIDFVGADTLVGPPENVFIFGISRRKYYFIACGNVVLQAKPPGRCGHRPLQESDKLEFDVR
jgi:hypothetical protein